MPDRFIYDESFDMKERYILEEDYLENGHLRAYIIRDVWTKETFGVFYTNGSGVKSELAKQIAEKTIKDLNQ